MNDVETALEAVHNEIDILALAPADFGIYDDNGMIEFALHFLLANLESAFRLSPVNHDAQLYAAIDLNDVRIKRYIRESSEHCFICGSDNIEAGPPDYDVVSEIREEVNCASCGETWADIYVLEKVEYHDKTIEL